MNWKRQLTGDYSKSGRRLILLDYDGTLVDFHDNPEEASPDSKLLSLLTTLLQDQKNEVVIISGRNHETLGKWFHSPNMALIAEHGAWLKEVGGDWRTMKNIKNDWKEKLRPILELFAAKIPGSFVEEKFFSLVWHYRASHLASDSVKPGELKDALSDAIDRFGLEIMEGNKVMEIKNVGIDKGRAALKWISRKSWGFILSVGDDRTDEDVFDVLPDSAYSIKVGDGPSYAKHRLASVADVRALLNELAGQGEFVL